MKKSILFVLLCSLLIACGDDNDEDNLIVSKTSCTLNNQTSYIIIDIQKGAGEYKISSENEAIALGTIDGNKICIWGFTQGNVTITISDRDNNKAKVEVSVSENIARLMPVSQLIIIKKGETKILKSSTETQIEGYAINDNGGMISAYEIDNSVAIKGEKTGEGASVYLLNDMWPFHEYSITVVDKYKMAFNRSQIELTTGEALYVHIVMGNGGYTIQSSNKKVVSATLMEDYKGDEFDLAANPATVLLEPLSAGTATITATDKEGEKAEIAIRVIY